MLLSLHVRSLPGHRYGFPVGSGAREGPVDERKRYVARSKDLLDFELERRLESKESVKGFAEGFGTRDGLPVAPRRLLRVRRAPGWILQRLAMMLTHATSLFGLLPR